MKDILKNIRAKLLHGDFNNEEQVRFSLVARILQALGWDIWDPNEVVTEYPVKKFPEKDITKEESGRVDIALFINNHSDRTPEVFLEIKAPEKLKGYYSTYEEQLQRYNYHDRSAISILTDGVEWKFYLPSAGGSFDQRLFNEFNIRDDSVEIINQILQEVLAKDNFRRKAIQTGEKMLEEMKIIRMINTVKEEAVRLAISLGDSRYEIAHKLLKNRYGREISLEDITQFWDSKVIENPLSKPFLDVDDKPKKPEPDLIGDSEKRVNRLNFIKKVPKRVFIIDKWYEVKSWRSMYILVCEEIIKRHPDTDLSGNLVNENKWSKGNAIIKASNGKILNVNLGAVASEKYAKKFLESHGYNVKECFKLEF
ncbi:MAG: type I restriction enzyme HsdR N-terminal domain-containing protein [Candidatus Cloacimonetes bacterium]|nr:type I restriction enzyme HsdR N-terminal domain-containing protein [Candidatus Cloacimonadota bacterium]